MLCFTCAGIGDTLTDSVVFKALAETYRGIHLAAVVHRRRRVLVEHNQFVDQIFHFHKGPKAFLELKEQLRAAGLSKNKMLALRDLAAKTIAGTVPDLKHIRRMSDEAIIEHLVQVRGIGRWTVEMLLIFRLGRPNVLPVNDFGVRKGFALTFGKLKPTDKVTAMDLPKPEDMRRRAKRWQPWCSVASWYLWRACDLASGKQMTLPS